MALTVIVATHNRERWLSETLESLLAQRTSPALSWEILVVDNGSTDHTAAVVETIAARARGRIRYAFEPRLGKSRALNTGIATARGKVLAFTDDDTSPAADWVATAAEVLDRWGADASGGRILLQWEGGPPAWLQEQPRLLGFMGVMDHDRAAVLSCRQRREQRSESCGGVLPGTCDSRCAGLSGRPQIWGGNMVIRRQALQALGGFDVSLGPVGAKRYCAEDSDMVKRLMESGHRVVYDPSLVVFHRILRARQRRRFMVKVEWQKAEGEALATAMPRGRCLLGVPRWRYVHALKLALHSIVTVLARRPDAFDSVLDTVAALGTMSGYLMRARLKRRRRAEPPLNATTDLPRPT